MIEYHLCDLEQTARRRTCLALDTSNVADGVTLSRQLADLVGMVKVGKELHTAAGMEGVDIVGAMVESGADVFLDLKFHDTPGTVYGAARAAAVKGLYMFNLHIAGGEEMCKRAMDGAVDGAKLNGVNRPRVIGVTVLTSLDDDDLAAQYGEDVVKFKDLVMTRAQLAKDWGLDGIVCPASEAGALEKKFGPWLYVTPGVEWKGVVNVGQKQVYTPDRAVQDCSSSILVLGSAVTKAGNVYDPADKKKLLSKGTVDDRRKAAYEILQAMAPHTHPFP